MKNKVNLLDFYLKSSYIIKFVTIALNVFIFAVYFVFLYLLFSYYSLDAALQDTPFNESINLFSLILDVVCLIGMIYIMAKNRADTSSRPSFYCMFLSAYIFITLLTYLKSGTMQMIAEILNFGISVSVVDILVILGFASSCLLILLFFLKYFSIEQYQVRLNQYDNSLKFSNIVYDHKQVINVKGRILLVYFNVIFFYYGISMFLNAILNAFNGIDLEFIMGLVFGVLIFSLTLFNIFNIIKKDDKNSKLFNILITSFVFLASLIMLVFTLTGNKYFGTIFEEPIGLIIFSVLALILIFEMFINKFIQKQKLKKQTGNDDIEVI